MRILKDVSVLRLVLLLWQYVANPWGSDRLFAHFSACRAAKSQARLRTAIPPLRRDESLGRTTTPNCNPSDLSPPTLRASGTPHTHGIH